ncbi:MAG TPA: cytochrome c [Candidatus Angelobacter sp.]|jgi:cytochrome c oxidase cbb3-type subunit 2|nr:cytochrome c [Candidatus Angelobacter sp.]
MTNLKKLVFLLSLIIGPALLFAATGDGLWMVKVPDKARNRLNPFAGEATAVAAGAKLYRQNCASCHGDDATGLGNRPSLHSERVRAASPGELEWLLKNGSMRNGMPSWSRLPEQQRWQIVAFLKSLQ